MMQVVQTRAAAASVGVVRPTPAMTIARISPVVSSGIIIPTAVVPVTVQPPPPQDMPVLGSQNGHLLDSWPTASSKWYLPDFQPADDPDPNFGFTATQAGVDASGNPFNKLRLTLGLKKVIPADVVSFKATQPMVALKEIPVRVRSAALAVTFKNTTTGADQQVTISGTVAVMADGSLDLAFENVLGSNVIILFENLRNGGATLTVTADYSVWQRQIRFVPIEFTRFIVNSEAPARVPPQRVMVMLPPRGLVGSPPIVRIPPPVATTTAISYQMPLGQKYATGAYLTRYTIAAGGPQRSIISVDDLRDYDNKQSEFRELHDLGDISQKYPSIAKLYIGVLSRTIVVVPGRYVIERFGTECAASCQVVLNSASDTGGGKFQFQFLLAPDISPVDLASFAQDVGAHPDLKDCTITTPSFLREATSTLDTIFKSSVEFGLGSRLHAFSLSVDIVDAGLESPAVASANLLIRQLCATRQPYLSGALDLQLDNTLADRIQAAVVLNLGQTVGTEGLAISIDEAMSMIHVTNHSAFNLNLLRYALCTHSGCMVSPLGKPLKEGQSLTLPLPADHAGLNIIMDAMVIVDGTSFTGDGFSKFLDIRVQDVQNFHCMFGVNAGAVAFGARGIARIDALISFADLPEISPVTMTLTKDVSIGSANVPIPIRAVVGTLGATLALTVHYTDTHRADGRLSLTNDFLQSPIFVLTDTEVGGMPAPG